MQYQSLEISEKKYSKLLMFGNLWHVWMIFRTVRKSSEGFGAIFTGVRKCSGDICNLWKGSGDLWKI